MSGIRGETRDAGKPKPPRKERKTRKKKKEKTHQTPKTTNPIKNLNHTTPHRSSA